MAGTNVLIAPDCFGDSLTAVQAAQAVAQGWRRSRPEDRLILAPQSDGGPGFVEVLASRLGEVHTTVVSGPLSDDVEAQWVLDTDPPVTAYIECAQACGLALLGGPPTVRTALDAHSRGVGQLVAAAREAGAGRIVVGLGGSGCTDGGRGMVEALGGLTAAKELLDGIELIAASDVEHPLLGPRGAAAVFGPQKGADPDTVAVLEDRLAAWAEELTVAAGRPVGDDPGAGAAGGIGAALIALGGRRESGAAIIAEHTGLVDDVAAADLVITGEGRFDDQSLHGKVVSALASAARAHRIPVLVLAGQVTLDESSLGAAGIAWAYSITDHAESVQRAIEDAADQLSGLASVVASTYGGIRSEQGTVEEVEPQVGRLHPRTSTQESP
ncbi:glycerate kinase family protein [Mycolicibacterium pyrenivorans]|uniref:glycerate kinase family protein n=1 Tax=Mycolicibacterium pyrenivorans TaxID=187102 RepID=UPI0021F36855|nr:glycerate kinase [Mycolicibacterium pyrenivorans]MCV7150699.1 glycerate kinase [Mycolicibacterium pyrenivorans]